MRRTHGDKPEVRDTSHLLPCPDCPDIDTHRSRLWYPCVEVERPLDLHGMFAHDCEACQYVFDLYGCPRYDLPALLL